MIRQLVLAISLWPIGVLASTQVSTSLDKMLPHQDVVSRVRIIEAKVHEFKRDRKREMCGISYKAEIVDTVSGDLDVASISFWSSMPAAVGQEYIVFLNKSSKSLPIGMKALSEPNDFKSEQHAICKDNLPELSGSILYEFYSPLRGEDGELKWLYKDYFSPGVPEEVKTMKVECKPAGKASDTGCSSTAEPLLIDWPSLRVFIQEAQHNR